MNGQGMWIWYVEQAEKGNVAKIVAKAKKHKIKTVLRQELRRGELVEAVGHICARVEGRRPQGLRLAVRLRLVSRWSRPTLPRALRSQVPTAS